ncbi:TPA: hypothetical protein QCR75_005740 [Bacillus anthracis]|nr:hypothetical protein [Bacillus anthracis]
MKYISSCLDIEKQNSISFSREGLINLEKQIKVTIDQLNFAIADQKIEYFRENVLELKRVYDAAISDALYESFSEELKLTTSLENVKMSLCSLRKQLNQENAL